MTRERRGASRHMVHGLTVEVDGRRRAIFDLSTTGVQVLVEEPARAAARHVELHFTSQPGFPAVDVVCAGILVRRNASTLSYRFAGSGPVWPTDLARFSIFHDLELPHFAA